MSKRIDLLIEDRITVAVIKDSKLINEMIISELINELIELAKSREHPMTIIDFSIVEFLSSGVLGGLTLIKKAAATHGTELKLCGFSDEIGELIEIVGFEKIFDIQPDRAAALAAFKA